MDNSKIGFDENGAQRLVYDIQDQFISSETYIREEWPKLESCIRDNWKGPDAKSYEMNFLNKLNNLRSNSINLVRQTLEAISSTYDSWVDFQNNNAKINGEALYQHNVPNLDIDKIKRYGDFEPITSSIDDYNGTFYGLVSGASGSNIKTAVNDFVNNVKTGVNDLTYKIETSSAFYGKQVNALDNLIKSLQEAIGGLTVSVEDLYNLIDKLVVQNYETQQDTVIENLNTTEQNLSDTVENRWNA